MYTWSGSILRIFQNQIFKSDIKLEENIRVPVRMRRICVNKIEIKLSGNNW